jgi:hypothetical protein
VLRREREISSIRAKIGLQNLQHSPADPGIYPIMRNGTWAGTGLPAGGWLDYETPLRGPMRSARTFPKAG